MIHDEYLNTDTIDAECATLNDEIEIVSGLTKKLIAENATTAIPQDEYNRKYDALVERYHAAQDRLDELQKLRITRSFQADVLECFMFEIKAIDTSLPLEYTDRFWLNLIDRVTVYGFSHSPASSRQEKRTRTPGPLATSMGRMSA